jgi:nucleoside-diphosphate-sugar epimerase
MPVRADSPYAPATPYDQSKIDAEQAIRDLLPVPGPLVWAVLRPVLVYGPGHRGNMARLEGLVRKGMPIPVASRPNQRSFLYLGNLVACLGAFLAAPDPPSGRAWIVADQETVSMEWMVRAMAQAMGVRPRLLHLPASLLSAAAMAGDLAARAGLRLPWNREVRRKLLGDFYVDIAPVKAELHWMPPFSTEQGIALTFPNPSRDDE